MWSTEINESTEDRLKHSTFFPRAGLQAYGGSLIQTLVGMRHFTFSHMKWTERGFSVTFENILILSVSLKTSSMVRKFQIGKSLFCECIVKVIFFAVNLPSQTILLSLRISYVFSLLSPLNLPLSCPELFVANRARRSKVFKVDVWVGNTANLNVAYGSLPSAFCSPRACVACQLSLVSVFSQIQRPHAACITFSTKEVRDAHVVVKLCGTAM